jgi:hypothetical protein
MVAVVDVPMTRSLGARGRVKEQWLRIADATPGNHVPRARRQVVEDCQTVLEILTLSAGWFEALHDLGIDTIAEALRRADEVDARLRAWFRVDEQDFERRLEAMALAAPTDGMEDSLATPLAQVVRDCRVVLASCPIDAIERDARAEGLESRGHRCRVAYSMLQGFVRRHDPDLESKTRIIGLAYATGRLSLDEAAQLLSMSRPDAVFLLEECGYSRSEDTIALAEDSRASILERIRADRFARAGVPVADEELELRGAISSERIEGVDARGWLTSRR